MTYRPPDGFIVSVAFGRSEEKLYDYHAPDGYETVVKVGTKVVVDSPFQGYVVVRVVRVKDETDVDPERLNRLVDYVDDSAYKEWAIKEGQRRTERQFSRSVGVESGPDSRPDEREASDVA